MRRKKWMMSMLLTALLMAAACGKTTEDAGNNTGVTNAPQEGTAATTEPTKEAANETSKEEKTDTNADSEKNPTEPEKDANDASETGEAKTVILDETTVKLLGRTQLMLDKNLLCAFSGSGVAFEYTGKKLVVDLIGDSGAKGGNEDSCARVAVYVNGERTQDVMVNQKKMSLTVFESEETQTVQVQIVKLSECAQSMVAICPIALAAGESIVPEAPKTHTMEFIGDSITCGYGVDDPVSSHHFSTQTEDATKTYAYKTAQALDADYSMVSISGYGIISGYTGNPNVKSDTQLIPMYYDKLGNSYARMGMSIQPQTIKWNFERFVPEVVVVNLGTNDASYCKGDAAKIEEFVTGYVEFIKQIREHNPQAEIVCTLGLMGQDLCAAVETACERYTEETGDAKVHAFRLAQQDAALGIAADWHPTEANHQRAAEALAEEIKNIMGW